MSHYLRAAIPIGLAMLTIALIVGAFDGMDALDWALVTLASFMLFLDAALKYRRGA